MRILSPLGSPRGLRSTRYSICRTMDPPAVMRESARARAQFIHDPKRDASRRYIFRRRTLLNVFSLAFISPLKRGRGGKEGERRKRDNRAEKCWCTSRTDRARSPSSAREERREERALYDPPRSVHFDPFDIREENHISPRTTFISPGDVNSPYRRGE